MTPAIFRFDAITANLIDSFGGLLLFWSDILFAVSLVGAELV